ncbi:MAG: hypothetical protein AAGA56_07715 [Myxococcota bacterium]
MVIAVPNRGKAHGPLLAWTPVAIAGSLGLTIVASACGGSSSEPPVMPSPDADVATVEPTPAQSAPPRSPAADCALRLDDFAASHQSWALLAPDGSAWGRLNAGAEGKASLEVRPDGRLTYDFAGVGISLQGEVDRTTVSFYARAPLRLSDVVTLHSEVALPWTSLDGGGALVVRVDLGAEFAPRHLQAKVPCDEVAFRPSKLEVKPDLSSDEAAQPMEFIGPEPLLVFASSKATEPVLTQRDTAGAQLWAGRPEGGRRFIQFDRGDVTVQGWVDGARLASRKAQPVLRGFGPGGGGGTGAGIGLLERRVLFCDQLLPLYVTQNDARFRVGAVLLPRRVEVDATVDGETSVIHLPEAPVSVRNGWHLAADRDDLASCRPK